MSSDEKSPLLPESSERSVQFSGDASTSSESLRNRFRSSASFMAHLTQSDRAKALQRPGVGKAAFLIRDALLGVAENPAEGAYDPYQNPSAEWINVTSIICRSICAHRPFRKFLKAVMWTLVLLSLVEPPSWCFHIPALFDDDDDVNYDTLMSTGHCPYIMGLSGPPAGGGKDAAVQYYPNASALLLTRFQALIVEVFCIAVAIFFMVVKIGRDGCSVKRFLRPGPARTVRLFELLALFMLSLGIILQIALPGYHQRVMAPLWRITILIAVSKDAQRELRTLLDTIPEVFNILFLLLVFIVFYAWLGVVLFYGTDEGDEYFPSLLEAMWSLWIAVTTANYPDLMMPAYNASRITTLYFILFMLFTFFFMMNVILSSVVNAYDNELDRRKKERRKITTENVNEAFHVLDSNGNGRIDRETVMSLFLILNEDFPEIRTIPKDDAKLLFAILDKDGSSFISKDEFLDFGTVMLLEFDRVDSYMTFVEKHLPRLYHSIPYQKFCDIIRSSGFETTIDVVLVLNAIVIAIQSYPLLSGEANITDPRVADGEIDTMWEVIETVFTGIYVLEFLSKVMVLSWKRYSESYKNLFDMTITFLAVFASSYVYYPNEYNDSRIIRYVVMARVLRLTRVLVAVKPFQVVTSIGIQIIPIAANVLLLLFCIMYFFAVLGVYLFGGMITRDPNNPTSYLLLNTDFSDNDYWANNFNDMPSALNVLFNLLVVNNWTQCSVGFEAAAQSKWTRLYFVAFHISGVILVNNVVVAFIVNTFIEQWDIYHEQNIRSEEVGGEATIEGLRAIFDASHVTGTETHLTGKYVARLGRHGKSDHNNERQQQVLKNLFTKVDSSVGGSEHGGTGS